MIHTFLMKEIYYYKNIRLPKEGQNYLYSSFFTI